jgi:phage host-nuclease inhibitor protein Gam
MQLMFRLAAVLLVLLTASAAAATNPEQIRLQKSLKVQIAATFKKQAPKLKLTTVTCKLPSDGVTAHCKARFTYGTTFVVTYPVTATIHDSGQLTWTAKSPSCTSTKTKKKVACG